MSEVKPGFYKATIFGKDRVGLVDRDGDFTYNNAVGESVQTPVSPRRVEDNLRPLIVLDLEDPAGAAKDLRKHSGLLVVKIADQIEAQTKPARIPEPGLWGVVYASTTTSTYRTTFIRRTALAPTAWTRLGDGDIFAWNKLIDPTLIHEGIN